MDLHHSAGTRAQQIADLTWQFLKGARGELLVYLAVMTGLSAALDLRDLYAGNESGTGSSFVISFASVFMYYFLLVGLVRKNGLRRGALNAGGVYFGIAIVTTIAQILGLILLIMPGVFLMIRWAPAYGYAMVEGEGVGTSLSRSMAATKGHEWAIFIAFLIPSALYLVGVLGSMLGFNQAFSSPEILIVLGNAMLCGGTAAFGAMGIAIYSLLRDQGDALSEVFE